MTDGGSIWQIVSASGSIYRRSRHSVHTGRQDGELLGNGELIKQWARLECEIAGLDRA